MLTFLLSFLCAIYTWRFVPEPGRTKAFLALMLLLETGMAGHVHRVRPDPVLRVLGDGPRPDVLPDRDLGLARTVSTRRSSSSSTRCSARCSCCWGSSRCTSTARDPHTFDLVKLTEFGASGGFTHTFQLIVFGAIALGFAIKVPMWPFHTWLPDAHTEAPTIGSVLLAGIMLKMGTYGFIRIALPVLPDGAQAYAPWIGVLAAIAIVYAALACLAQRDLKRLIAFSSVGHMGFVMLGIATLTDDRDPGGDLRHGRPRRDHRDAVLLRRLDLRPLPHARRSRRSAAGMSQRMPKLAGDLRVRRDRLARPARASPGSGARSMALLVAFQPQRGAARRLRRACSACSWWSAAIGTMLTAGYFLWMLQRVNMGTMPERWNEHAFGDVHSVEWMSWTPLLVLILALGLFPRLIFGVTEEAVNGIMAVLGAGG